jgi:hypothetical protein
MSGFSRLMMIVVSLAMLLFFTRMTYADKEAKHEYISVNLSFNNNARPASFSHNSPAANSFHSQATFTHANTSQTQTFSHARPSINQQRNRYPVNANASGWRNNNNRHYYSVPIVYYIPYYVGSYPDNSNDTSTSAEPASNETDNTNQQSDTNQVWVAASNGEVPNNAVVYSNENGNTTYYCRGIYNNVLYTGELVPNEACYAQDGSVSLRFDDYDVLVD